MSANIQLLVKRRKTAEKREEEYFKKAAMYLNLARIYKKKTRYYNDRIDKILKAQIQKPKDPTRVVEI